MRPPSRSPRFALVASALAGLLLASVAIVPSYAALDEPAAQPAGTDPVTDPGTPAQVAEESLAEAEDLVEGDSTEDPTLVLNQLSETLDDLPPADRRKAERILGRPTAGDAGNDGILEYSVPEATPYCRSDVCVHYVPTSSDRPPMTDTSPADGVPDWVDETARVMGSVWTREVDRLGYRAPLPDRGTAPAGTANDEGPDTRLDVYLGDIGAEGYYGYVAADRRTPRASSAYLVLDDDFQGFGGSATPGELLRVTAAHELFHVVQFAYDQYEDDWFMEATATWMEEQVYDAVNDNRLYLPASALAVPTRSLDHPAIDSTAYGNWIFFEYLSRRHGVSVVKAMWSRAVADGVYSMLAISRALKAAGTSLPARFATFSAGNLTPLPTYSEGYFYPRPRVAATYGLSSSRPGTGTRSVRLDHLASRSYAFTAGSSLTGTRRLRVRVDGPTGISGAVAVITRRNGTVQTVSFRLDSAGNGALTLPFTRSSVTKVTLTVANTSVRYTCGAGSYSCNGRARDQAKPYAFSASAIR